MHKHPNQTDSNNASIQWAEKEFASLDIKDARRVNRLKKMAADFHARPGESIPQASGGHSGAKAAYRLMEGGRINAGEILASHADAVFKRVEESREPVLLVAQDTTSLNFAKRPNTSGLGPIGNRAESGHGFFVHGSLCVGAGGEEVFGLLGAEIWARDPRHFKAGPAGVRNRKPIEQKESNRWLESWRKADALHQRLGGNRKVVSVADREGDIYEAFALCLETKARRGSCADLLVRAQHDRQRVVAEAPGQGGSGSWSQVGALGVALLHTIEVPRAPGRPLRQAVLEVRCGRVEVEAPAHKRKYLGLEKPLSLWLIVATEVTPPPGQPAICWRLWTTVEIGCEHGALEVIGWYAQRWQIEEFHRILKSGCKSEERQLESFEKLSVAVALDMVVASCLLALTKAVRREPEATASRWLGDGQWKALHCYINKTNIAPHTPPSLKTAVGWIARLGGFMGRKGDGFPGPQVLWRGWRRLEDITAVFQILNNQQKCG